MPLTGIGDSRSIQGLCQRGIESERLTPLAQCRLEVRCLERLPSLLEPGQGREIGQDLHTVVNGVRDIERLLGVNP
jgi:hypothetical protein